MANGKPTPRKTINQKEYEKQVKRIKSTIKRLSKIGIEIPESVIPKQPKRITKKTLHNIQKINAKSLKQSAQPTTKTNVTNKSEQVSKQQTKRRAKVPQKTKKTGTPKPRSLPRQYTIVLDNITELIRTWSPQSNWTPYFSSVKNKDKNILSNILEGAISQEGEQAVARRLNNHATEIMDIVNRILYESGGKTGRDQTQLDLQRFSQIIMGRRLTVEESKNMTEIAETMNGENTE